MPESFTVQYFKCFLDNIYKVFSLSDSQKSNVLLDVNNVKRIDMLGLLLLFKFMDYTVKKKCFFQPETNMWANRYLLCELDIYGFKQLLTEYYKDVNKIPNDYNLKFVTRNNLFIAPLELARDNSCLQKERDNQLKIATYYEQDKDTISAVLQCIGEVASNFKEHAVEDTKSILVAQGNKREFELACVDNGMGIDGTLRKYYGNMSADKLLEYSIKQNVTSKPNTFHTGHGLWLINEFAKASGGTLLLVSNNTYLLNKKGKLRIGQCNRWQGTILYLKIYLNKSNDFINVMKQMDISDIKLNII